MQDNGVSSKGMKFLPRFVETGQQITKLSREVLYAHWHTESMMT